jgi:hypothetical protein
MSHDQTTGHKHYIKVPNESTENKVKFKYLEVTVMNQEDG